MKSPQKMLCLSKDLLRSGIHQNEGKDPSLQRVPENRGRKRNLGKERYRLFFDKKITPLS